MQPSQGLFYENSLYLDAFEMVSLLSSLSQNVVIILSSVDEKSGVQRSRIKFVSNESQLPTDPLMQLCTTQLQTPPRRQIFLQVSLTEI